MFAAALGSFVADSQVSVAAALLTVAVVGSTLDFDATAESVRTTSCR